MQRILVALDGSPLSEEVIPYAAAVARQVVAKLDFLRVIDEEKEPLAAAEAYVAAVAGRCHATGRVVTAGNTIQTILDDMNAAPGTLLALTTHGRSGITEEVFGSVALNIVRHAGQPVLLYRPAQPGAGDKDVTISTVVAPLDGSEFAERILPHATDFAKSLGAELQLVQVIPETVGAAWRAVSGDVQESSYVHSQARLIARSGVRTSWEVLHGDPARAIAAYIGSRRDVILAMTSHARAGLSKTLFGSVMSGCLRTAGVPVFVYHPPE